MYSLGIFALVILLLIGFTDVQQVTASVQVSSLPGITTDVRPLGPMASVTVWRKRIWRRADLNKRGRQGRIVDTGLVSPDGPRGERGNERPIVDNECGPRGCEGRGGRRKDGRKRRPGRVQNRNRGRGPFSKRQLKLAHKLTNATAIFAGNLLTFTLGRGRLKDACVSPMGVHMALTMLTLGARGGTQRQINEVAGLTATRLRRNKAHRAYHAILTSLSHTHPKVKLLSANAVFVKRGIPLELAFRQNLEQLYQAKFSYYPLAPMVEVPINDWVAMTTNNNIPRLLNAGTISNDTDMVVLSAMALTAPWNRTFNVSLTRPQIFETLRKELKHVHMMEQSAMFMYKEEHGMKILQLPFQSLQQQRLAMYLVIPDLDSSLRDVMDSLTGKNRTNPRGVSSTDVIFQNLKPQTIKLRMPRFSVESDVMDLSRKLRKMGMRKAFSNRKANLKGISLAPLRVDKFLHKSVVRIDEYGSSIALPPSTPAQDSPEVAEPSMELVVDRPFMFFFYDVQTRLILLNGLYTGEDLVGRSQKNPG